MGIIEIKSSKIVIMVIPQTCNINNFQTQNTVLLYLCSHAELYRQILIDGIIHFVELQTHYVLRMLTNFHNETLFHKIRFK